LDSLTNGLLARDNRPQLAEGDMARLGNATLLTDAVDKVSKIELWNWNLKLSNPGKQFFESRLRARAWS
jgi:hypothetical protein